MDLMGWDPQDQFFRALLMVHLSPSPCFPVTMGRHCGAGPRGADSCGLNCSTSLTPTEHNPKETTSFCLASKVKAGFF